MSNVYKLLEANFTILQKDYPDAILDTVKSDDVFNTDGMAGEAKFKIIFIQQRQFLTTVYVKDDGSWFMTADSIVIKKKMRDWIESVIIQ